MQIHTSFLPFIKTLSKHTPTMSKSKEPQISHDINMEDVVDLPDQPFNKNVEKTIPTDIQFTIKNPPWSYIHLSLITTTPNFTLDTLTAHLNLRAALSQFLGLHGTAIPIDILKLQDNDVHVRVPREDASAVIVAVGGWIGKNGEGWRVKQTGCWGPTVHSNAGVFQ
jgi:ribonuclease P/MRP protein subunit POP8